MQSSAYTERRSEIETYFDRTAVDAWKKLTSDEKVSKIRETVRAGRDRMRGTLLSYLPEDLHGQRILDAGCGTGAFAVEAARRGASVVAIDLSPKLVTLAAERIPADLGPGSIEFHAGDMLDTAHGTFDHVVAMDSMIHYRTPDLIQMLANLTPRIGSSILFTHAPRTPLLMAMHTVGKIFPRGDRSPAIVPVAQSHLHRAIDTAPDFAGWEVGRSQRINSGFYLSSAQELVKR